MNKTIKTLIAGLILVTTLNANYVVVDNKVYKETVVDGQIKLIEATTTKEVKVVTYKTVVVPVTVTEATTMGWLKTAVKSTLNPTSDRSQTRRVARRTASRVADRD